MKTKLLHSYSSNSIANLGRVSSRNNLGCVDESSSSASYDDSNSVSVSTSTENVKVNKGEVIKQISKSVFRKKLLYKKLPILSWAKKYTADKLLADIISGLTIGLTILPQGLAYASIAGLPPQYGLYSGFMGCFVYVLFGSTKVVTIGPTAILGVITLSYTRGAPPEYAVLLCFLSGIVTLLMGLFQLGFLVNFISTPVISAFTSAAALTICSTQIKALLGLSFKADEFREIIYGTFEHSHEIRWTDASLSAVSILVLFIMQNLQWILKCCTKDSPKLDRVLWFISTSRSVIVILICTIIFSVIGEDSFPVNVVGKITPGLPPIRPPQFTVTVDNGNGTMITESFIDLLREDMSALIVIPLLALMEHYSAAKKFTGKNLLDVSQEMISIGLTNIFGSFFSSMPVTGSFSRSTVNAASGACSPLGGLVTGTLVILALEFLTPFFYHIPNAALAAVIVSAVIFTLDFQILPFMWKSKRMDLLPWGVTFFLSLLVNLEIGILSGVFISVTFLLYYAARPAIQIKKAETGLGNEFVIVSLDRSLVFPSVEYTRYMIMKSASTWAKGVFAVVIDCNHIQFADFTAAQGIRDLFVIFNEKKHELILWRAKPSIIRVLKGLMDSSDVPFKYCMTEEELERIIDGDEDGPIQFSISKGDMSNAIDLQP